MVMVLLAFFSSMIWPLAVVVIAPLVTSTEPAGTPVLVASPTTRSDGVLTISLPCAMAIAWLVTPTVALRWAVTVMVPRAMVSGTEVT